MLHMSLERVTRAYNRSSGTLRSRMWPILVRAYSSEFFEATDVHTVELTECATWNSIRSNRKPSLSVVT